ncbi:MAG: NADH-quinone oxidoreductase subunit NuoE [Dermatophilaceae bacterium]
MSANFGLQTASGHFEVPEESKTPYPPDVEATLRDDAAQIIARYPQHRSALLPMLHLVQSVDGYITGRGLDLCAELLDLTTAEVSGVATFYTQYKRHPNGEYTVGVCTNTLCAIMGGDEIWDAVSEHLGIGHDETTEDGRITLERVECNAACDYAPVVMTNWEFFDNQTPQSTIALVDDLRAGTPVTPTRGPRQVRTFKEVSRVLAGFQDGLADEGVGAGRPSVVGLELAKENGWEAPRAAQPTAESQEADVESAPKESDGDAPGRTEVTPKSPESAAGTQAAPKATDPADEASGPHAKDADEVTAPDSAANEGRDEIQDIGMTDPDEVKGDGEGETR